jgi:hypothetical protein
VLAHLVKLAADGSVVSDTALPRLDSVYHAR